MTADPDENPSLDLRKVSQSDFRDDTLVRCAIWWMAVEDADDVLGSPSAAHEWEDFARDAIVLAAAEGRCADAERWALMLIDARDEDRIRWFT